MHMCLHTYVHVCACLHMSREGGQSLGVLVVGQAGSSGLRPSQGGVRAASLQAGDVVR